MAAAARRILPTGLNHLLVVQDLRLARRLPQPGPDKRMGATQTAWRPELGLGEVVRHTDPVQWRAEPDLRDRLRSSVPARGSGAVPGVSRRPLAQPASLRLGAVGVRGAGGDVFSEHPNGADQRRRRGSASVLGVQLHRYRRRLRPGLVLRGASCCCRAFRSARPLRRAFWAARCQDRCRGRRAHRHVSRVRGVGDEHLLPLPRERARRRRRTVGVPGGRGGRRLDGGARPGRHSGGGRPVRVPAGRFG